LFKLKLHNTAFWLVAPTLIAKHYYDCHINERIDKLWKIHCNRVDKGTISIIILWIIGLGGTHRSGRIYNDKMQDYNF
jgi:hypothetical protein